jgi:low temperature requirement protein LtrA
VNLKRRQEVEGESGVSPLELFYDLVFVFAITQVAHLLLEHLTWEGVAQSAVVLLVVWWAWNYTTWFTNELDTDATVVRLVVIALMLASLVQAVAIPQAFGAHGLLFAGAFVAIQIGRHAFLTFAATSRATLERERSSRILIWFVGAGALWIAGGLAAGGARWAFWLTALALDYAAPLLRYHVPGRARLPLDAWHVETAHFAERFQLFVIIALGETIVVTGVTTTGEGLSTGTVVAFGLAFLSTAAFWWLYFDYVATIARRRLELSDRRTQLARDAYTYLHVVLIAGVIVAAVGDEIVIVHPGERLSGAELAALVGGPALYLLGHVALRLRMTGSVSGRRLVGTLACVALAPVGLVAPALVVSTLLLAVLVGVIASERVAAARRRARGEPSPLERLEASGTAR